MKSFSITVLLLTLLSGFSIGQTPTLIYGPYLQMGGQTSLVIRWRTDMPCDSKVTYGLTKNNLSQSAGNLSATVLHSISIGGLTPNTKYWYTVSASAPTFTCDTFFFHTASALNTNQKIRVFITGDCGSGQAAQLKTRDAMMNYVKNNYVNAWIILGDNAYVNGLDNEYTSLFFQPYQNGWIMHNTCLYPCPGNHDYANDPTLAENKSIPYYNLFTTPLAGELGGVPSNSKSYYSFNIGNIHFVSLDSYGTENSLRVYDTLSPHYQWVKQDLASNNSMWTIVYFHHPPYSMGSHNSDTEPELFYLRQYLTPLFEKHKVDLVMSGHSHNYERSWLIKGHTGLESTFSKTLHRKDSSSARYDGSVNSCPYIKDSVGNKGVVYTVCGSTGWPQFVTQAAYPHNAMYYSNSAKGIGAYVESDGNRLNAVFIGEDSVIYDKFTILKNVNKKRSVTVQPNVSYTFSASWNGNYLWSHNQSKLKQSLYTPQSNTLITVRDSLNCIADTFQVNVIAGLEESETEQIRIYPNPASENRISINGISTPKTSELYDMSGVIIQTIRIEEQNGYTELVLPQLPSGMYLLKIRLENGTLINKKILVK